MKELTIKGFIETSFIDWDGKVASVLFLPYCNFRCPCCHNFGLIENPEGFKDVPLEKVESFLLLRKDFIDGICLTGGEPCLHKDKGLFEFMKRIKDLGFQIKLDTNGVDPECIERAINQGLVDYIAMDIKGPLDERYDKLSGVKTDLEKIKQSISMIMQSRVPYEFRTTVIPTLLNSKDIEDIAKYISGAEKFVLQQFVAENAWNTALRSVKPYDKIIMERLVKTAKVFVSNTIFRGV